MQVCQNTVRHQMEDNEFILESARRLERWENTPRPVPDGYADMNRDELIKLAVYQRERMEEVEAARRKEREESAGRISALTAQVSELTGKLSELTEQLRKNNESLSAMVVQLSEQSRLLREKDEKIAELQSTVKVERRHLFDRKSQKGTRKKDDENRPTPHTDVKGDFDGTPESQSGNLDVEREGRGLHDRQQLCGTVHPALGERAEELAVLRQRQDGACQCGLPLHCVHLQASGIFNPGIPQEVLCRDRRRQPRLRKTYALNHRHKC